jgi:anti-sigma factor RsiW
MSDIGSAFARLPDELPGEDAAREERHQLLAMLLGAFADGELPAETASQIDAHLLGCARCRRELQVHKVLRRRLEQEPVQGASSAFRDRIAAAVAAAPTPQWESVAQSAVVEAPVAEAPVLARRPLFGRALAALAVLVLIAVASQMIWPSHRDAPVSTMTASSQPLLNAVMTDYRRVTAGDLPGRARDLATVRAALPFPVLPATNPAFRLLAAWTTVIENEPAAVLAYRWRDQVVLQYILADQQLYRPAALRDALAGGRAIAVQDGDARLLGWAEASTGTLVVGSLPMAELRTLREGMGPR